MLILFFCTYFATFGYKRPCDFETLFHIVTRVFPAISAGFNTSVGTTFDNAVSAPVFRLTTRTGNLFIRHEMIPIPDLHPQLGSVAEFFVCLLIWMCNIPWAGSTIISASRYYLFHYPSPHFALLIDHEESQTSYYLGILLFIRLKDNAHMSAFSFIVQRAFYTRFLKDLFKVIRHLPKLVS